MPRRSFEIRVVGVLGPAARNVFRDLAMDVEPTATVISGELNQDELHFLLDQIRALGLQLIDIKQAPNEPPKGA